MTRSALKVSVVVPVYNVQNYLGECLHSLASQTLDDLEIVIVDDGSTDRSSAIIDQFLRECPRARAFHRANAGVSEARNFGITQSLGKYVGFVDADDYVAPDMFERLYTESERTGADIAICPVTYMYRRRHKRCYFSDTTPLVTSVVECPGILLTVESYACNKLFRRDLLRQRSFQFPNGQHFEDSAAIYNIMLDARKIALVKTPLYNYRRDRDESITAAVDSRIFDVLASCKSILRHYDAHPERERLAPYARALCAKHVAARLRTLLKGESQAVSKAFAQKALEFLDREVEGWRSMSLLETEDKSRIDVVLDGLMMNAFVLRAFLALPLHARVTLRNGTRALRRRAGAVRRKVKQRLHLSPKAPMTNSVLCELAEIGSALDRREIVSFLDFGTLLGVIREGKLLAHDADIDIGVLSASAHGAVCEEMGRKGFQVWRQYFFRGKVVEESYRRGASKIDVAYYAQGPDSSTTWLFYRKPGVRYENNERHVVEMRYRRVGPISPMRIGSILVNVPTRASELLEEKYGPDWRKPDPSWIYWRSPAATSCDEMGYYRLVEHTIRTPWVPKTVGQKSCFKRLHPGVRDTV